MSESKGDLLLKYGNAAEALDAAKVALAEAQEAVRPAKEAYDEARASIQPAQDAYNEALQAVREAVEELGADPFKALKGAKTRGGPRGPRDPQKRERVVDILRNGGTVQEILDSLEAEGHTGYDKQYINSVINSLRQSGNIEKSGDEKPFTYRYVG
jgi:hypothetical protein